MIIGMCITCNKKFKTKKSEVKRGFGKFCSRSCSAKTPKIKRRKRISVNCAYCQIAFEKTPSKIKQSKSGLHFCCRKHKDLGQRLENELKEMYPSHYGKGKNYRAQAFREFENKCNKCGYSEYPQILQVHHKDLNRKNNKISNLEILCPNCHIKFHLNIQ
jgi:5-methylcytosine-specific restriction endonuclease McrA